MKVLYRCTMQEESVPYKLPAITANVLLFDANCNRDSLEFVEAVGRLLFAYPVNPADLTKNDAEQRENKMVQKRKIVQDSLFTAEFSCTSHTVKCEQAPGLCHLHGHSPGCKFAFFSTCAPSSEPISGERDPVKCFGTIAGLKQRVHQSLIFINTAQREP
eukprot:scaffold19553_cov64-Cyclotella_meneghiniana.AAC.2